MNPFDDLIFYHIYPLGLCGAPRTNDGNEPGERLRKLFEWADYIRDLGANAVYFGPLFESVAHGYDTTDYFRIDSRLGTNDTLRELVAHYHSRGIKVVLDGVFNHCGRRFPQFLDVIANGQASQYCGWFDGLDFGRRSPLGDPFDYKTWAGHYSLVKFNLRNPDVRRHLFDAVAFWIREFGIDGVRLDAADSLDFDFMKELSGFCKSLRSDFLLLGEVVHGDYGRWANPGMLDTVTNYEVYKGLWSAHNDVNYFEIGHSLEREFGERGIYKGLPLYNFADNHDVPRAASILKKPADIFPLYVLLFTIPGMPSIYYGSERGLKGVKENGQDYALRPAMELGGMASLGVVDLLDAIKKLIAIRKDSGALRHGSYETICLNHKQFAFARRFGDETVIVAVNSDAKEAEIELKIDLGGGGYDLLNGERVDFGGGAKPRLKLYPEWGRIVKL